MLSSNGLVWGLGLSSPSLDDHVCTHTQSDLEPKIIRMPSGVHYTSYRSISHKHRFVSAFSPLTAYSSVNMSVETADRLLTERLACDLKAYSAVDEDSTAGEFDLPSSIVLACGSPCFRRPRWYRTQSPFSIRTAACMRSLDFQTTKTSGHEYWFFAGHDGQHPPQPRWR